MPRSIIAALLSVCIASAAQAEEKQSCLPSAQEYQGAHAELNQGDSGPMKAFLLNLKRCYIKEAAKTASQLGELASHELNYISAALYFAEAERLDPKNPEYGKRLAEALRLTRETRRP